MPRQRRAVIPNCPHHITQRGNNRRDVFFSDRDRELYLTLLKEYSQKDKLDMLGYCLMTNHVHIVATPTTEHSLAKVFGRTPNTTALNPTPGSPSPATPSSSAAHASKRLLQPSDNYLVAITSLLAISTPKP